MSKRIVRWAAPGLLFTVSLAVFSVLGTFRDNRDAKETISPDPCVYATQDALPKQGDGPSAAEVDTRLHGCQKVSYTSLQNFLVSRGVDISLVGTPDTAGELYKGAKDTFGVPPVDSRTNERSFHTTAEATKLFDIFLRAAPEIIANIEKPNMAPACVLNGVSKPMFEADNTCVSESVSCMLGRPATKDDLTLCNAIMAKADAGNTTDLNNKKHIAVATLLAAGHTCE